MKNSPKYKLFLATMIFAFMWVIIGDLVNMHIKVIYGDDIKQHQPFAKTNNSDKNNLKVKFSKKHNDNNKGFHYFAIINNNINSINTNTSNFNLFCFIVNNKVQSIVLPSHGRAPPTITL